MRTKLFALALVIPALACKALSTLPAETAAPLPVASTAPAARTATATAAGTQSSLPPGTLRIVSSMPMKGSFAAETKAIANAEELRLEQAGYQACGGKYKLAFEAWNDGWGSAGNWDKSIEESNANKAATDPSIIAYLGTFNSGAAKVSIPILNHAGPLIMISPANTYPGLTKSEMGELGEPGVYYPTGVRNYARVIEADDVQGATDARYMFTKLDVKSVFILDDGDLYGQAVADMFESTAKSLGMKVLGRESIDPTASSYHALMNKIALSNGGDPPDGIFASMVADNNAAQVLKDKVAVLGGNDEIKFMGPDGIVTQSFVDAAGKSVASGAYASIAGRPFPDGYTEAGKGFVHDYEAKYGKLDEPYAIYGYEAMNVLLKAIEDVCAAGGAPTDRARLREAVFAIKDFDGALGTWSFDQNGDTTLTDVSIYVLRGGYFRLVQPYK